MEFKEVVFTKVSPETRRHNRRFFERHVRRMFIKYLAYTNQFDGVLNDREIEEAKLGHLPADLDVHHIFPIAGSESEDVNSFTNLTVLHKTTHIRINREIFAPQLKEIDRMPEGAKLLIRLPLFEPVDAEGILRARMEATRRGLQRGTESCRRHCCPRPAATAGSEKRPAGSGGLCVAELENVFRLLI